ncbi:MAG: chaperone NapD [Campylobacteraceae bacterium]|nr:chaperone NapD [Campylobacteraceae bacterium]
MNISSIVVYLKDIKFIDSVKEKISSLKECEIIADKDESIVVVVSSDDFNSQIAVFKTIKEFEGVLDVAMIYNYDELEDEYKELENAPAVSQILDDEFDAKNVKYSGTPRV